MNKYLIILLASAFACTPAKKEAEQSQDQTYTIAFGSCSKQNLPDQQLWAEVIQENPDLWIWLGDNIYADTEDMEEMKAKYDLQKSHPDYQQLISQTDIIGVWDDHDYGANDVGKEYAMKDQSRDLLFDFLDVDPDNEAWNRKGAYQNYDYNLGGKKVKVLLLDARYYRDSLVRDEDRSTLPNETGKVLGEEQWSWLENQLSESADLILVGSGIQLVPEDHSWEKWANFPSERDRLFKLIAEKVKVPIVFLTGDRHISEVSKMEVAGYPFPLYDLTSSSLTTPWGDPRPEENKYRVNSIIYDRNFAVMDISWNGSSPSLDLKFVGAENEELSKFKIEF